MCCHSLWEVSAGSRFARGVTGDSVAALDGERWLSVHVDAQVRSVVVSRPGSCCQVLRGPSWCHSVGHGVAGAGGFVGDT